MDHEQDLPSEILTPQRARSLLEQETSRDPIRPDERTILKTLAFAALYDQDGRVIVLGNSFLIKVSG